MRFFDNNTKSPDAYYEPNSFGGPRASRRWREPPLALYGNVDRPNVAWFAGIGNPLPAARHGVPSTDG